jgi:predicted mannosyl-3-phosphoglycerate phosphatase (HAD superfamily)
VLTLTAEQHTARFVVIACPSGPGLATALAAASRDRQGCRVQVGGVGMGSSAAPSAQRMGAAVCLKPDHQEGRSSVDEAIGHVPGVPPFGP